MAMADGFVVGWYQKRHFAFWRPVTAIRKGDTDEQTRARRPILPGRPLRPDACAARLPVDAQPAGRRGRGGAAPVHRDEPLPVLHGLGDLDAVKDGAVLGVVHARPNERTPSRACWSASTSAPRSKPASRSGARSASSRCGTRCGRSRGLGRATGAAAPRWQRGRLRLRTLGDRRQCRTPGRREHPAEKRCRRDGARAEHLGQPVVFRARRRVSQDPEEALADGEVQPDQHRGRHGCRAFRLRPEAATAPSIRSSRRRSTSSRTKA